MLGLIFSSVFIAICIIVLSVVTFSLARQIGVLHERTQPIASDFRPVPSKEGEILSGLDMPADTVDTDSVMLLFVATNCPICRVLHSTFLASLAQYAAHRGYWVFPMDTPAAVGPYAGVYKIPAANILVEANLAEQCAVSQTPTLVRLQRHKQGWRLQLRRSIVSGRQLQSLLASDLQTAEGASTDYRLEAQA
tara:strand:+ start:1445 stop:2023 length:579 start_codon:yes stop_codon:yes gene_type:complete